MAKEEFPGWHGTTIIGVRKGGKVVVAGDGQVSLGQTVIKGTARKVRRLTPGGMDVVAGFAGSTADAFTLLERLEAKLEATPGQLARAAVELAKDWRMDKYLKNLEAMLIVTDGKDLFVITGAGDVLEPEHDVAAVASGVIDESQAVSLQTLSDQRMGYRANMVGDDEPFELFKGFAEIFVTVGLGLLMAGFLGLAALLGDVALIPIVALGLSWVFALYFTKKRRMALPSITLSIAFALSLTFLLAAVLYEGTTSPAPPRNAIIIGVVGMIAMAGYFRVFRLPFAMFVFGVFGVVLMTGIVDWLSPDQANSYSNLTDFFDLRTDPALAIGTLVFGVLAFVAALWFDTKDPHRISRYSATAFWLHILAAPALVNTLVMSNYAMGGVGTALAVIVLTFFTLLAIIIDRRSFLTAGLIYMGHFPGKERLPPYAAGLSVSD